uniref:Uncharacterized protein n=1 Tax=Panagrolaimus sp. JU765 TaxID=591449 RepID=A0AC34PY67_9BILA
MTFNGITLLIIFLLSIFNFAVADESLPKNILDTNFQIEKINNSFFLINGSEKRPLKKCKPEQNFENGKSYGDFLFLEFSTVVQKYMMIYSTKTDWNVCYRVDASYFTDTKVLFFNLEKSTIEFAVIDGKNANFPVDYFSFFANDNIKSSRAKLQVNQTLKILELHLNGQMEKNVEQT